MSAIVEPVVSVLPTATKTAIAVAEGDGIGPEIMHATLRILEAAECGLELLPVRLGKSVYEQGINSGVEPGAWEILRQTRALVKAPLTTPQGGGFKSVNVTLRKSLGLYANVRPCVAYAPFVKTRHPNMDVVIIRENEEDLYAGIEHRQTDEVMQCLKLITRPGCERIVRYAFEYAQQNGRRKVTCMTKDNIMKLTDGLFHKVFDEIATEYPAIAAEHMIVDIGAARLADTPDVFDVVVMPNLYGDILSDVAAQIAGSIGVAGSANLGEHGAMFEAIHGSAPDIAGKDVANPSALLMASVMMLVHLGKAEHANVIKNAWLRTIEDGVHTADLNGAATRRLVGTKGFAAAVIERLGEAPQYFAPSRLENRPLSLRSQAASERRKPAHKETVGIDIFLHCDNRNPEAIAESLQAAATGGMKLVMVTNRGVKVWPEGLPETFCTDHWRCRFMRNDPSSSVQHEQILQLMSSIVARGLDIIKTEWLCNFDGQPGFAMGQGQ